MDHREKIELELWYWTLEKQKIELEIRSRTNKSNSLGLGHRKKSNSNHGLGHRSKNRIFDREISTSPRNLWTLALGKKTFTARVGISGTKLSQPSETTVKNQERSDTSISSATAFFFNRLLEITQNI